MSHGIENRTLHAFFWSFIEKAGIQGVQFFVSIVLARLLLPEQYGLIGMLVIFLSIGQSFIDSGFGSALIQKQNADHVDKCSIFYFNIVIGLFVAGLLCFLAPAIAQFYKEPQLKSLTRFLSLSIIINSFGLIQATILIKHLDFKTQAKISILSVLLSGPIGIMLAYNGYGVWSLAIQQVCASFVRTISLWFLFEWRPSLIFSGSALRKMFAYGSRLLASGLLNTIFENIYSVVIGKLLSAVSLGYYTRAANLQQLTASVLSDIAGGVTFPLFSRMQHENDHLKAQFRVVLTILAYINFPLFVGLIVVAKPLVIVLLTDKWLPCYPYLQLLAVVGLMYPLHAIHLNLLKAMGRSDIFFKIEIVKKIFIVAIVSITWRYGIEAMILGQIILSLGAYFLNSYFTVKLINYPLREQINDLAPVALLSIVMGSIVFLFNFLSIDNQYLLLMSQVLTGFIVYLSVSFLFKLKSFLFIVNSAKNII